MKRSADFFVPAKGRISLEEDNSARALATRGPKLCSIYPEIGKVFTSRAGGLAGSLRGSSAMNFQGVL